MPYRNIIFGHSKTRIEHTIKSTLVVLFVVIFVGTSLLTHYLPSNNLEENGIEFIIWFSVVVGIFGIGIAKYSLPLQDLQPTELSVRELGRDEALSNQESEALSSDEIAKVDALAQRMDQLSQCQPEFMTRAKLDELLRIGRMASLIGGEAISEKAYQKASDVFRYYAEETLWGREGYGVTDMARLETAGLYMYFANTIRRYETLREIHSEEQKMVKSVFVIARDYSRQPFGRLRSQGTHSGESLREDFLIPALTTHNLLIVDLDGAFGYDMPFLKEAFGRINPEMRERIVGFSRKHPSLTLAVSAYLSGSSDCREQEDV